MVCTDFYLDEFGPKYLSFCTVHFLIGEGLFVQKRHLFTHRQFNKGEFTVTKNILQTE